MHFDETLPQGNSAGLLRMVVLLSSAVCSQSGDGI